MTDARSVREARSGPEGRSVLGARPVTEERIPGAAVPAFHHPGWAAEFPWLVQGISARGDEEPPFDLGFFGGQGGGRDTWDRWSRLTEALGCRRVVHGPQVHGSRVRLHRSGPPGLLLAPEGDGHITADPDVLLAVSVADCVPVSLVDPAGRAVALLHAGWRGIAAGVLERGVTGLWDRLAVPADRLRMHAGPAICGACYEVGPEVHDALGLEVPSEPTSVDLRAALVERAVECGIQRDRITVSTHCTRCGDSPFFSHRRGDGERQVAFLGIAGDT